MLEAVWQKSNASKRIYMYAQFLHAVLQGFTLYILYVHVHAPTQVIKDIMLSFRALWRAHTNLNCTGNTFHLLNLIQRLPRSPGQSLWRAFYAQTDKQSHAASQRPRHNCDVWFSTRDVSAWRGASDAVERAAARLKPNAGDLWEWMCLRGHCGLCWFQFEGRRAIW